MLWSSRKASEATVVPPETTHDVEKIELDTSGGATVKDVFDSNHSGDEIITDDVQAGVKKVQATLTVWTKNSLIAAYVFIWLIYVVTSLQEVLITALDPYVTSAFSLHSLTAATDIMASIIGGLTKLPIAKILDVWGRPQGLALMLFIWVIGYIMMAGCNNVETYAAAQVFSQVGSQGVSYVMTVFISDTSSLKNRGLMLAFATSPYIFTTWVGGPISESVLAGPGWRWGFGIFSVVVPFTGALLFAVFYWNQRKATKQGLIEPTRYTITLHELKRFAIEVDLLGILILAAGMALFLLPFSLYTYQEDQWRSPMIICMIIFGGLLIIAFALYERYLAPVTFIPFDLLADRTVFFGGMMFVFLFAGSATWSPYFYSMLQVVWNLSVTEASYISSIFRVGQCLFSIGVGLAIRWTGRFKPLAAYFGMPLMVLAVGLMIYFRRPNQDIGYVAMCQIFVSCASGVMVICGELAMMAPSDQQHLAVILAILNLFGSIGTAVGSTIAAAVWTSQFDRQLLKHVPDPTLVPSIYQSLDNQLSYPVGSDIRVGIDQAYGETQRLLLITSLCLNVLALACVLLWRDIGVKNIKQVKGRVV